MSNTGDVKRNPDTGEIAIRTTNDESEWPRAGRAWLISTTTRGARFAPSTEVETWDDLYQPGS